MGRKTTRPMRRARQNARSHGRPDGTMLVVPRSFSWKKERFARPAETKSARRESSCHGDRRGACSEAVDGALAGGDDTDFVVAGGAARAPEVDTGPVVDE